MKKLKYLLTLLTLLIILPIGANAASGKISITSSSQVVLGNTVTVTVTLSSSTAMGSWDVELSYDKNYLQLTSSTAEAGGTLMVGYTSTTSGVTSKTYTFKFKTLKTGSTNISIGGYTVYTNDDMSEMSMTTSTKTIKIITQAELEASYSKDNSLKSLTVDEYELTPQFTADTTSYSVDVPEDTEAITINAAVNDSTATVTGTGTFEVTAGTNTFDIIVKAQNGSERTYTLTVNVIDSNPIEVTVNDKEYTVVKIKEYLPINNYYSEYSVTINEYEIPAYINEYTNIILVGLKDSSGNISLFTYDPLTNTFDTYTEIGTNKITIIALSTNQELNGYSKKTMTINDEEVEVFYYNDLSNYVIIYGKNVETGEEDFYMYDLDNQVVSLYNQEYITDLEEQIELYTYIIIGFISLVVVMFIILILTIKNKHKRHSKKINNEEEKLEDNNEIIEIKSDEEIEKENVIEENKKEVVEEKKDNNEITEVVEDNKKIEVKEDTNKKKDKKKGKKKQK